MSKRSEDIVNIREVYDLMGGLKKEMTEIMGEIKSDMKEMKTSFENLEAGRLTRLESKVSYMDGKLFYVPVLLTALANIVWFLISRLMISR